MNIFDADKDVAIHRMLGYEDLKNLNLVTSRSSLQRQISKGVFPPPLKLPSRFMRWHPDTIKKWLEELK